jgi:hypothetical protein
MTIAKDLQLIIGAIVVALCSCLVSEPSSARTMDFSAPEAITVTMYELTANGVPVMRCDPVNGNLTRWGCTAYCDNPGGGISCASPVSSYPWSYPNPYQNPVTVQIEGQTASNRYLRDVVPAETSPALFHPTAVGAQAIAARTYAYWHIKTDDVTPGSINNSSAYQVFVPYRYDTFAQGERDIVDAALQGRYYLSNISAYTVNLYGQNVNLTADDPIFAEFFADRPLETLRACLGSLIVLSLISDLITGYCPQHSTHS